MTIAAGEYADTLRALGHFLDDGQASNIEIVDQGSHWLVASGKGTGSETLFVTYRLEDLCSEGRLRRGASDTTGEFAFKLSEILRTLGQILDVTSATSFTIHQVPEGFRLISTFSDGQTARTLSLDEIRGLADLQREIRKIPR